MPKYFVDKLSGEGQTFLLEGDVAHHLKRVLRARIGEKITLCNGKSMDFYCEITRLEPLTLVIEHCQESKTELPCKIILYQGMLKSDKLEWIIQKSIELGVHSIVPVYTKHSVVRKPSGQDTKMIRYQKIAESAASQSMRGIIPIVHSPIPWEEAFKKAIADKPANRLTIAAHEKEQSQTLKNMFYEALLSGDQYFSNTASNITTQNTSAETSKEIGLWIGPEGGFSEDEIKAMESFGFQLVSLGPRILRAETAAIAALAQIVIMIEGGRQSGC